MKASLKNLLNHKHYIHIYMYVRYKCNIFWAGENQTRKKAQTIRKKANIFELKSRIFIQFM
jgi:hypothetical protein